MKSNMSLPKPIDLQKLNDMFGINYGIFSKEEQERITRASLLIVGVGAVGGVMAEILARSGVANFTLIDPDVYDLNNSNRHIGWFVDTIGKHKSEVIKEEIQRINPEASIEVYTRKLSFTELDELINQNDIVIAAADDLAFSSKLILMAQERKKFAITFMPSGISGYILVFPPCLSSVVDPAEIFGAPKHLSYEELHEFLENPLTKFGRRWYILQGKWRIKWFRKWMQNKVSLAQICPNTWLGASLSCIEVIKYLTGKWKPVKAPKIWQIQLADNRIRVEPFRRRTQLFNRLIYWLMNIRLFRIGERVRSYIIEKAHEELNGMEAKENMGQHATPPFLWRHLI